MLEPSGIHILQDATKISCTTKTQHSQVNNTQIYIVPLFIFFKKSDYFANLENWKNQGAEEYVQYVTFYGRT